MQHLCETDLCLCAGGAWEQHFVKEIIELHDKYMLYVSDCFANSSLFHKALKEAFESFCNKSVAGSSIAELMANFCDNLLRKVWVLSAARQHHRHYAVCLLLLLQACTPWQV